MLYYGGIIAFCITSPVIESICVPQPITKMPVEKSVLQATRFAMVAIIAALLILLNY